MSAPAVLLVEDDPDQARLLTRWLEGAGRFDVCLATDGDAASRLLWSRPWSLVISDIQVPGVDGLGLLRRFRAGYPDTPFILISSRTTVEDAHTALRLHADDFLPKPLDREALIASATRLTHAADAEIARAEAAPDMREQMTGLAEQVATSMTLAGGVADILAATGTQQPIDPGNALRYAGFLHHAARGLEGALRTLGHVADAASGRARADAGDVTRDALHAAGTRLSAAGVTLRVAVPEEAVVVGIADHHLRRVLHATLTAVAENATLCGLRTVSVAVRPANETVSVEVALEREPGEEMGLVLQNILGILSQESMRAGVHCLVAHAGTTARLRFTLTRIVHRRSA